MQEQGEVVKDVVEVQMDQATEMGVLSRMRHETESLIRVEGLGQESRGCEMSTSLKNFEISTPDTLWKIRRSTGQVTSSRLSSRHKFQTSSSLICDPTVDVDDDSSTSGNRKGNSIKHDEIEMGESFRKWSRHHNHAANMRDWRSASLGKRPWSRSQSMIVETSIKLHVNGPGTKTRP